MLFRSPPSAEEIARINANILANAGKYIDVPWSPYRQGNQQATVAPTIPPGTFYGTDNPFTVLSDVFRNVFGSDGDVGQSKQTGQALVPVTSTSGGGSSSILLILIVLGVGGIAYYFYKKRQSAQ